MRIAHLSDLHLLSLEGAVPGRLFNKRATGYANLKLKREHAHHAELVTSTLRAIREAAVDHVVITGDVTNLALEVEYELVRRALDETLAMSPRDVTIVPGNHDVYTGGAVRSRRFATYFAPYLEGDLPELAVENEGGSFPVVKLRGNVAFVGLSSAVTRPPLVAAGRLGDAQLAALERVLAHPEVARRTLVLAQHHPLHTPESRTKRLLEGLHDAAGLRSALEGSARGLVLHGHLHRRIQRRHATRAGHLDAVGATSASLAHASDERHAGFNVYEIADDGSIASIGSRLVTADGASRDVAVPTAIWR